MHIYRLEGSMADIKSAWEIVKEKVEKVEAASPEELLKWRYVPEGEKLAARFLKENVNLNDGLGKYGDEKVRKHVTQGALDVLIRNISLPRNDAIKKTNRHIMDTVKGLKNDKVAVENVYSKIRRIFSHYVGPGEEQRKQAYGELKYNFAQKLQEAMRQQLGTGANIRIDVERQPEFQAEWRRLSQQLDAQYEKHLEDYKGELAAIG